MRKYGIEHFHIELLEETNTSEEREIFWIENKRSFKNGYNATMGGDGRKYIDYDLVISLYQQLLNKTEVARRMNIDVSSVNKILSQSQVEVLNRTQFNTVQKGKIVHQYDLDGKFLNTFPSLRAAAESLGKITKTSNGASNHISEVCKGKRKTAYGYIWKFSD